jgi:hypothetical protein
VLLSWLYLSAQVLLYAAEVNVVLARRLWPRSLLQSPLTGPDQQVLAVLAQIEERLPEETIEVRFSPLRCMATTRTDPAERCRAGGAHPHSWTGRVMGGFGLSTWVRSDSMMSYWRE